MRPRLGDIARQADASDGWSDAVEDKGFAKSIPSRVTGKCRDGAICQTSQIRRSQANRGGASTGADMGFNDGTGRWSGIGEFDDDGEIADYKLKDDPVPELEGSGSIPHPTSGSLHEMLLDQLRLLNLNQHQTTIAEQIIGSNDDDGYLRRDTNSIVDDLAFKQNIETTEEEVESLITSIQQFDPSGIGARDERESLMIQLTSQW